MQQPEKTTDSSGEVTNPTLPTVCGSRRTQQPIRRRLHLRAHGLPDKKMENQVAVEKVILQQENGSMAQRVQAEFLSELCRRIEAACPDQPPGGAAGMFE